MSNMIPDKSKYKRRPITECVDELRREIESNIEFLKNLPYKIEEEAYYTLGTLASLPLEIIASNLRNTRIFADQILKLPRLVAEDLRDIPDLTTRFLIKSPSEARKDIKEYLSYKKKVRPLNLIDLTIDILDTILPG